MRFLFLILILLMNLPLPISADMWLVEDPIPDRATAEKLAQYLRGKVVLLGQNIVRLREVSVENGTPKAADGTRKFTFKAEQDVLFRHKIIGEEKKTDGSGGVAFYKAALDLECGDQRLVVDMEELPESFAVLKDGILRWLGEALRDDLPDISAKYYVNPPQVLQEKDVDRLNQCIEEFDTKRAHSE